jgi:hypothetical protein
MKELVGNFSDIVCECKAQNIWMNWCVPLKPPIFPKNNLSN